MPGLLFLTNWILLSGRSSQTTCLRDWQLESCQAPSMTAIQGSSPSPPRIQGWFGMRCLGYMKGLGIHEEGLVWGA